MASPLRRDGAPPMSLLRNPPLHLPPEILPRCHRRWPELNHPADAAQVVTDTAMLLRSEATPLTGATHTRSLRMTKHGLRNSVISSDQPAHNRAAPISERARGGLRRAFLVVGSGRAFLNASTATLASPSCELLLPRPVTSASQTKRPRPAAWKDFQSKKALTSPDSRRIRRKTQATSVKPVARDPVPAPADQGRLCSPSRAAVNSRGSSATGNHSGHSKPSATLPPATSARPTKTGSLRMSLPDRTS